MFKKIVAILSVSMLISGCSIVDSIKTDEEGVDFFIAVHLEPVMENDEQGTTLRPERYWNSVVNLVAAADEYNQKLTLLMNPQWGIYILSDDNRLDIVHSWESNGHEIGIHYHGPEMGSWSGYTNQERFFVDSRFQGTTQDIMDIMNQIPQSGEINTCTINDADADFEFPIGVAYSTDGGLYGVEDLVSVPEALTLNNQEVLQVLHAKYGEGGSDSVSLENIMSAIDVAESEEVIGIVFHDKAFESNPLPYIELFTYLNGIDFQTQTITQILNK